MLFTPIRGDGPTVAGGRDRVDNDYATYQRRRIHHASLSQSMSKATKGEVERRHELKDELLVTCSAAVRARQRPQ